MPAYNDTPQVPQQIDETQPLIRTNFTTLQSAIGINHVVPFTAANYGKHSKVDITAKATHDLVAATQLLLYNFVNPTTTTNELYIKKAGALGVAGIPFTAATLAANNGWTYLPSGLLMKWGYGSGNGNQTINVNGWGPTFNNVYGPMTQVTTRYSSGSTNGFAMYYSFVSPTLTIRCCSINNPAANLQTDYSFVVFGD